MELEHLRIAGELMKQFEKRNPEELLPTTLPAPIRFESNIDYVREIMAEQTDWNAYETEFLPPNRYPTDSRYEQFWGSEHCGEDRKTAPECASSRVSKSGWKRFCSWSRIERPRGEQSK